MNKEEFESLLEEAYLAGYNDAIEEAFEELHERNRIAKSKAIPKYLKDAKNRALNIKDVNGINAFDKLINIVTNHPLTLSAAAYKGLKLLADHYVNGTNADGVDKVLAAIGGAAGFNLLYKELSSYGKYYDEEIKKLEEKDKKK